MYFSVITPREGKLRQAAHHMTQSPYAEHQWMWQFFPGNPDEKRDFIYHRQDQGRIPRYYVVSQRKPKDDTTLWEVQSKRYAPQLHTGHILAFELRANPVVSWTDEKRRVIRHDVVMHAKKLLMEKHGVSKWNQWESEDKPLLYELVEKECERWLKQRAEKNGFEILSIHINAYTPRKARKTKASKNGDAIRFTTVDFSGELKVTDPVLFQQVLYKGIGHAKGFGCGLLLVKPGGR